MDISKAFIRAHQFSFPEREDETTETPFTIKFDPQLNDIELFLEDVFGGDDPFYMPGVCRPITSEQDTYSVGAIACPIPENPDEETVYDIHYPSENTVWFDVSAEGIEVYVRETVSPERIQHFCEKLSEFYGVTLHEITGLPAVPQDENLP